MHKRILIPVALDHEGLVSRKIDVARRLLDPGGRITLLTLLEDIPGYVAEFIDLKPANHLTAKVKEKLDAVAEGASDIETVVETGKAGIGIVSFAEKHGIDLIIVGSQRPGVEEYFLGSTAARVARRAPCAVYILR